VEGNPSPEILRRKAQVAVHGYLPRRHGVPEPPYQALTAGNLVRERESMMSTIRKKMSKAEVDDLFQKATEAINLFSENPDVLRGFVDSLRKGDFSQARMSIINASLNRRREEDRVAADPGRVPWRKRRK